jgi:hypothetical protein
MRRVRSLRLGAQPLGVLGMRARGDEGAHVLHLLGDEALRIAQQPVAGAREQEPVQQRCGLELVGRLGPDLVRAPDALEVGEEAVLLGQPAVERRPCLEQRLMRDLDDGVGRVIAGSIAGVYMAAVRDEQPRVDQRLHQPQRIVRQVGDPRRLPHPLAVVEPHPHQVRHEGVAQRSELVLGRLLCRDRLIGDQADRILDRVEAARGVAQRLVVGETQPRRVAALVQQP